MAGSTYHRLRVVLTPRNNVSWVPSSPLTRSMSSRVTGRSMFITTVMLASWSSTLSVASLVRFVPNGKVDDVALICEGVGC